MRRGGAALLLGLALAGCGAQHAVTRQGGNGPQAAAAPLQQAANGPVAANPATTPLSVRLADLADRVGVRFRHPPRSGLLFDVDTGEVLWRHRPTRILPIASLTKMMTALLVAERAEGREKVRITPEALRYTGSGIGLLPMRKRVRLGTLLHGLMLVSGNDAATALAQHVAGTVDRFVAAMNARALAMGLMCTRFSSPSGVLDAGNHSCAADLAALTRAVLDEPEVARVVRRRRAILPFPIKGGRLHLYNTNPLLRRGYPGIVGVKTGYTRRAGRCLVAAARRGGRRLAVVLLGAHDPGRQAQQLLDRGFEAASS